MDTRFEKNDCAGYFETNGLEIRATANRLGPRSAARETSKDAREAG